VRLPAEASRISSFVATVCPSLSPAQQRGLSRWVFGVLLADAGGEGAVVDALAAVTGAAPDAVRQQGREWLRDGADKLVPCAAEVAVAPCFATLLRWVVSWWPPRTPLPLLLDTTYLSDRLAAQVISVAYRGTALPVAWAIVPATAPTGSVTRRLFAHLAPAVSPQQCVLVLSDRGLWSPQLWRTIRAFGWHPLLRIRPEATFAPTGQARVPAATLVAPGQAWIGTGSAFRHAPKRLAATLVAVWGPAQREPWLLLTDLPPHAVDPHWYELRMSIEASFASFKSRGWQWQRTRRHHPTRVTRHWLVLAVATLLCAATGTRLEEAARRGRPPAHLPRIHDPAPPRGPRIRSILRQGRTTLHRRLLARRPLWADCWLLPEPWSPDLAHLTIVRVVPTLPP
jgi:hypothetical protein